MKEPPTGSGAWAVRGVVVVCHALVIVTAVGLLFFAHAQVDDLWRAALARRLGWWGAIASEYNSWTGRWLGVGLSDLLSTLVDVRRWYAEILLSITVAYLGSLWYLLRGVLPGLSRPIALLLSVVQLELYWTGLVTPGETFYWMTGGFENHIGLAMPMLLVGLLVRTRDDQPLPRRVMRLGGLVATAVAATGFNELYGAMLCGLLAVGTAVAWLERRPSRLEWSVATLGALIGCLIVYSAPGNAVRAATVAHLSRDPERAMRLFREQASAYGLRWFFDVKLQAASLAFVLHPRIRGVRPGWCGWTRVRLRWLIPALTIALLLGAVATHAWLTGEHMAPRTLAALYMVFLVGWFATLFAWTRWPQEAPPESVWLRGIAGCSTLLLAVSLALAPATRIGLEDLRSLAPKYDAAMKQRWRMLDGAVERGEKRVVVPPLPATPRSFFDMGIVNDPADFRNSHTRRFYGLESVTVR